MIPYELLRRSRSGEVKISLVNAVATKVLSRSSHRIYFAIAPPQGSRLHLATDEPTTNDGFILEAPSWFHLSYIEGGHLVTREWWVFNNSGSTFTTRIFFAEIPEPWLQ